MKLSPCRTCSSLPVLITVFNGSRIVLDGDKKGFKVVCDVEGCWVGPIRPTEYDAVREWNLTMKEPANLNLCIPI